MLQQTVRYHLSSSLLFSAFSDANEAAAIEVQSQPTDLDRWKHQGAVVSAIISSAAFVEACANELYADCAEVPTDIHLCGHPQDRRFGDIGASTIDKIAALWQIENFQRSARPLEKLQVALRLAGKPPFDQGANPFQDAKMVIDLRNELMHSVPETKEYAVGPMAKAPLDDWEPRLAGKFPVNPMRAKYAIISVKPGGESADYPFFPDKCLGSGCALWAYRSSLKIVDDLFHRLGTTWYYHFLFDRNYIQ